MLADSDTDIIITFVIKLQLKLTKKSKSKSDDKNVGAVSNAPPLDSGLLQEELQKKIIENAQFASQVSAYR